MAFHHLRHVYRGLETNLDSFPSQPHSVFNIELRFTHFVGLPMPNSETLEVPDVIRREAFIIPRDRVLSHEEGPRTIASILSSTGSSSEWLEIVAVPNIFRFAWEMDRSAVNSGQRVLTMVINLSIRTTYDDREFIDLAIDESYTEALVPKFRPASKDSIHNYLEKVRLQDLDSGKQQQCTVCLEEFDDHEITRMPCGHVYHEKCIVKWLETSNTCPLCRYEMPS